ncbi:hypothetical protein M0D69_31765 [Caballeronia sp. SEWSISQ10-4 2]|uniref:hypothetical protein n=1 Tax=Caballeronia sp. SEWSISQ10-4 2 TaxID=2937438 RepID=UPI002655B45B|nr:hypothetical protein [Caballeronia sp. SEWSISQ10-4 2]MDN7182519.1 hypothetical protein [Caballeronia sp. SEWSISQ10-4 2]
MPLRWRSNNHLSWGTLKLIGGYINNKLSTRQPCMCTSFVASFKPNLAANALKLFNATVCEARTEQ